MDRALISLKFTMLRHTARGLRLFGWIAGAILVAGTWALVVFASPEARHSVLTLSFALWGAIAALGPVLTSGAGVLRPSYFALLPLTRAELGRGILLSVFVSIAASFVLLTLFASGVHALALSPATIVVAVVGALLTWVLVIAVSRLVFGLLGAAMRSKVGIEIAGIQFGLMFAAMFTGWMIVQVAIQTIPRLLTSGIPDPTITAVLDAFPTSWSVLGIERAASGDWGGAALLLAALLALDVVVILATIPLLAPRVAGSSRRQRQRPRSVSLVAGGGVLPRTQLGAVIGKELRQWNRDGWRSLEVRSAVWTGIAIGAFALASVNYSVVAAFSGLIVAFMLGIAACTVYSQDGTAVWQTIVGQDETSVQSDVRGRQWAPVLIFFPQAVAISAIFVILSGEYWTIPIIIAALPALFGAASGAAIIVAAVGVSPGVDPRQRVGPNDAVGNISIHVWIVMLLITVGSLPTVAAIIAMLVVPAWWTTAIAMLVGIANGFAAAWLLGRVAIGYLRNRMPDVFSRIRYGRIFRDGPSRGAIDWFEASTLKGEQQYREALQKQREERLARERRTEDAAGGR